MPKMTGGAGWSFEPAGEEEKKTESKKPQKFRMALEYRSGKVVTVLYGLHTYGSQRLEALAKSLKMACGTGGTVKDGVVELQGDRREQVRNWMNKNWKSKRNQETGYSR